MISYLGSLDQFSPAVGRAGRCRQMLLCVGSTRRALARKPAVLAPSPQVLRAPSLCDERPGQPEVCRRSPRARCAFSLRGPSARCRSGLRKSLDRNPRLFARREGVASLGMFASCPSPCLLLPAGMGRLFSGVSQPLCFVNRRRCVPAGSFFRSPTV